MGTAATLEAEAGTNNRRGNSRQDFIPRSDWRGIKFADLPASPIAGVIPELVPGQKGFSWRLVADGISLMQLGTRNDILQWNKVKSRTHAESQVLRQRVLERSKELLSPDSPMTQRHLFYLLISEGVLENSKEHNSILSQVTTDAREDGEIDDASLTDDTRVVYRPYVDDSLREWADGIETTFHLNPWLGQKSYCECWFEKGAVMSVVESLHREYQVTMRPFKGQASRPSVAEAAKDFARVTKPITVYYFGDHDPSGYAIPRSVESRVREILDKNYAGVNSDFTFIRAACNPEHFAQHNLKPWDADLKKTDSNYPWFIKHYGHDCAELDAIPPDELRKMVRLAIESHITDWDAWSSVAKKQEQGRRKIKKALARLR